MYLYSEHELENKIERNMNRFKSRVSQPDNVHSLGSNTSKTRSKSVHIGRQKLCESNAMRHEQRYIKNSSTYLKPQDQVLIVVPEEMEIVGDVAPHLNYKRGVVVSIHEGEEEVLVELLDESNDQQQQQGSNKDNHDLIIYGMAHGNSFFHSHYSRRNITQLDELTVKQRVMLPVFCLCMLEDTVKQRREELSQHVVPPTEEKCEKLDIASTHTNRQLKQQYGMMAHDICLSKRDL